MDDNLIARAAAEIPQRTLVTISELARLLGIDKGGVSRRVAKLEADGKLRPIASAREKYIDLAEFEAVTAEAETHQAIAARRRRAQVAPMLPDDDDDLAPEPEPAPAPPPGGKRAGAIGLAAATRSLTDANVEVATLRAEMAKLDLAQRRRQLLAVSEVQDAMVRCAGVMVRLIDGLPNRAADIIGAASANGERGVRVLLRTMATELREALAREMGALAEEGRAREEAGPIRVDVALREDESWPTSIDSDQQGAIS
jgi:hypothetical protein